MGGSVQIVGDDLLVTNPRRVAKAIEEQSCNALLLKVHGTTQHRASFSMATQHRAEPREWVTRAILARPSDMRCVGVTELQVNQIGSVTEAIEAVAMAQVRSHSALLRLLVVCVVV